jgi:hypothetical protein
MPGEEIRKIKDLHKESLMRKPNVIGLGTGYKNSQDQATGKLCLVALVQQKLPKAALSFDMLIPQELEGVKTDVIDVGYIRPQQSRTARLRPAPGGISLGHYQITAGTFGCIVHDNHTNTRLILSNNHVLANHNRARVGDPILQPAPSNGGLVANDTIATLTRFSPIKFGLEQNPNTISQALVNFINQVARFFGSNQSLSVVRKNLSAFNLVDAAVAQPSNDSQVSDEIMEIGVLNGTLAPTLGMAVRKSGKATGLTTGTITVMDVTIDIDFLDGNTARFEDQIVTSPMSQGGDSGSILVHADSPKAVGLLFAGSDKATIHNPIQAVLDAMEVHL